MSPNHNSSPDIYPGLDDELDRVYERNVAEGLAKPIEDIAVSGLETVVEEQLQQRGPEVDLSPDAAIWVRTELNNRVLGSWSRYEKQLGLTVPKSAVELLQAKPEYAGTLERLYRAKQELIASNETTPEGLNVGETMRLVLIPWRGLKDNLTRLPEWVKEMRGIQGTATNDDYLNENLLRALQDDTELYHNPIAGHFFSTNGTTAPEWISASDYLKQRIAMEGDWGIMLVQTSDDAGLKRLVEGPSEQRSPDALTNKGAERFKVAGHNVDGLGVLEWLSLTFQEGPSKLSSQDASWLLANRLDVNGVPCVPNGDWYDARVKSRLRRADDRSGAIRPRLAVM